MMKTQSKVAAALAAVGASAAIAAGISVQPAGAEKTPSVAAALAPKLDVHSIEETQAADGKPVAGFEHSVFVPTLVSSETLTPDQVRPVEDLVAASQPSAAGLRVASVVAPSKAGAVAVKAAVQASAQANATPATAGTGFQVLYRGVVTAGSFDYTVEVLRPSVDASKAQLLVSGHEVAGVGSGIRVFDVPGQATAVVRGTSIISVAGAGSAADRLGVLGSLSLA